MADIHGEVAAGFESVRDAFASNFEQQSEVGAAFALYKDGVKVVDLWGGVANADTGAPWQEDTLQWTMSTTKGATAACAHLLAQRGLLDYDAPVAEYWPEFKQNGKENIPVRWLLSHRAGLPTVDNPVPLEDLYAWDPIVDALAAQKPYWEPGTKHGYHALTYGYLVGEVVRRISGKSLGAFLAEEVTGPTGAEYYIGLPPEHQPRVSRIIPMTLGASDEQRDAFKDIDLDSLPEDFRALAKAFMDPNSLSMRSLNLTTPGLDFNDPRAHQSEIPAASGIGTARGIARMYASFVGEVDGVRILNDETIKAAATPQSVGPDEILIRESRFGLGFMIDQPFIPFLTPAAFGHDGAGGYLAFGDPSCNVGFAYVMNKMHAGINADERAQNLIRAVRGCIEGDDR